jgi:spore coat protein U-like protein
MLAGMGKIGSSTLLLAATGVGLALSQLTGSAVGQTTSTTTFQVSSAIAAGCSISATSMMFGYYFGQELDATSTIAVTCTNTTPYDVALNGGENGNTNSRKMADVTRAKGLKYSLSRDAGRTQNWGDRPGTDTVSGTGTGIAQLLTVYGRVDRNQNAGAASYLDIIRATITF